MLELSKIKKDVDWKGAKCYTKKLGQGWRMPTRKELTIILGSPKARKFAVEGVFWTSTTEKRDDECAYIADFYNGEIGIECKEDDYSVRCIRGSRKDLLQWCFGDELVE